jgi:hypothetical protein
MQENERIYRARLVVFVITFQPTGKWLKVLQLSPYSETVALLAETQTSL